MEKGSGLDSLVDVLLQLARNSAHLSAGEGQSGFTVSCARRLRARLWSAADRRAEELSRLIRDLGSPEPAYTLPMSTHTSTAMLPRRFQASTASSVWKELDGLPVHPVSRWLRASV
jgi:hypothetical protein